MAKQKKYVARYERDENNYWSVVVEVDAKRSAVSDGQTLPKARRRIRQSLAALLDVAEKSLVIEDKIVFPSPVEQALASYSAAQREFEAIAAELMRTQRRAAQALVRSGLSRRDAGDVLGITGQRVQQVLG